MTWRAGGVAPARRDADGLYAAGVHLRRGSARYWLSLVAGALCLVATSFVGPVGTWLLLVAAFGLLLDGITVMWERAGGTGNLTTHRQ